MVNLPWFKDGRLGVRAGSRWPFTSKPGADGRIRYIPFPFFLAQTTALLKKNGKDAVLIDAIAEEMSESVCIQQIRGLTPDYILVETSTPTFNNDIRLIHSLREALGRGLVRVGLCGAHAGEFAVAILKEYPAIDHVIAGEYEQAVLALINALEQGTGLDDIAGLAYRRQADIVVSPHRAGVSDLDALPWPERSAPVIYKYNDGFAGLPVPNVQMLASRGCPFKCSFCLLPQTLYRGSGYRKRNARDVVDEMEDLVRRFDFKAVYFDDDNFSNDRGHVIDICGEILQRGLNIPWAAMTRVDLMDEELLKLMSRAGIYAVKYGIESADDNIRRQCGKRLDLNKAWSVIRISQQLGIKVHLTFCVGLPGETRQTWQKTIDFVREINPDSLQFSFAIPFPGTEYYNKAASHGWLSSMDWDDYDGNDKCMVRTDELSSGELENLFERDGSSARG